MRATKLWALVCLASVPVVARAQSPPPSARDRAAAAEAYDRGSAAYLARDYATAAQLFETANRLAPAPASLIQAIRAHGRAGNTIRGATLALRLDPASLAREPTIQRLLERAASESLRVDVVCDGCTIDLDGVLQDHSSFFVAAGSAHTVTATFGEQSRSTEVTGSAGEQRSVEFERPATTEIEPAPEPEPAPAPPAPVPPARRGLSPTVALVGGGVALVVTGFAVWSGLDALAGVDDYEAHPTQAGLDEGQGKELRTNLLIAGSGVLAAATLAIALFFTDWSGGEDDRVGVAIVPRSAGASLVVGGRL